MKTYSLTINGNKYDVTVEGVADGKAAVSVNGIPYEVALDASVPAPAASPAAAPVEKAPVSRPEPAGRASGPAPESASSTVTSPLPGVIIEVSVKEGQAVRAGEKVAVLEAMKMENEITAPRDGTVTAIHAAKGDSVLEGAPVVTIA
jgi:biotin carboxyl carrier protein